MAHEILNTLDPVAATRWVNEYERRVEANKSDAARNRGELGKIIGLAAEALGITDDSFKKMIKKRKHQSAIEVIDNLGSEDEKEELARLEASIGDLPLGQWAVSTPAKTEGSGRKRNAAAPGTVQAGMTLADARAILSQPKGRGRPSKERLDAEKVVAEADAQIAVDAGLKPGASGAQAEAMAEAMGPDDRGENVEDLRPRFMQTPPEAA